MHWAGFSEKPHSAKPSMKPPVRIVQVVGPRCACVDEAEMLVRRVVAGSGLHIEVQVVREQTEMAALGVFAIPGIVVDGLLKTVARIPSEEELRQWLSSQS
jgi:small redox-active disulfide protein 2